MLRIQTNTICTTYNFDNLKVNLASQSVNVIHYVNSYCAYKCINKENRRQQLYFINHVNDEKERDTYSRQFVKKEFYQDTMIIHKGGMTLERYQVNSLSIFRLTDNGDLILKEKNILYVVTNSDDEKNGSLVLRIIRELLFRTVENHLGIIMHAAACFHPKYGGILICGDKGKGKTTLLFDLLKNGCSFVANDRVVIESKANGLIMKAVPLCIRAGAGTVAQPYLDIEIDSEKLSRSINQDLRVLAEIENPTIFGRAKIEFTPYEISQLFNTHNIFNCELKYILFPDFSPDNISVVEHERPKDSYDILKQSCCTPNDVNWLRPWLLYRKYSKNYLIKNSDRCIQDMLLSCKIVRVSFGCNIGTWKSKKFFYTGDNNYEKK